MDARIHLDTLITPERSLPLTGFKVLLVVLIVVNLVVGGVFLAMGAWPAPIFLGLDVLGVWVAFRISYRRAATRVKAVGEDHTASALPPASRSTRTSSAVTTTRSRVAALR